jgi:hypothetical protein
MMFRVEPTVWGLLSVENILKNNKLDMLSHSMFVETFLYWLESSMYIQYWVEWVGGHEEHLVQGREN